MNNQMLFLQQYMPFSQLINLRKIINFVLETEEVNTKCKKDLWFAQRRDALLLAKRMYNGEYFHVFKWIALFF